MKKFSLLIILLLALTSGFAQRDSIKLAPKEKMISIELTKLIEKKGYRKYNEFFIKDHFKVLKNDNYTLSDSLGNIFPITAKEDAIFYAPSDKIVLTYNRNVNNGREVHLFDLTGKEITIEENSVFKNPKFHLVPYIIKGNDGGGTIFLKPKGDGGGKQFNTPYGDYLTILEDNPTDGMSYVKLISVKGNLIIKEDHNNIEWIGDRYLLLVKNNIYTIYDLVTKQVLPVQFQDVWKDSLRPELYYTGDLIAKNNGKYGLFDLKLKKWTVPAMYDDLAYFNKFGAYNTHQGVSFTTFQDFIFTHILIATSKDKKGAISRKNDILVPIKYDKIYCDDNYNPLRFTIYQKNTENYYDVENKKELFPKFYNDITLLPNNKAILRNEYEQYVDYKTNEIIISENEKVKNLSLYKYNILLEYADKSIALYNNELKKIVCSNVRRIDIIDGTQSYFRVARSSGDYKKDEYIIDPAGNTIVNYTYFDGKLKFANKLFVVFNALKESEIYGYYNLNGEKVDQNGKSPLAGNRFMPKK